MNNPFLIGDSIYLRQVVRDDAENYYQWLNDQETTKYMQRGIYPTCVEDCRKYVESMQSKDCMHLAIIRKREKLTGTFADILKDLSEKHIGNIALLNIHPTFRSAEISIILGECRGHGYGTEAIRLLVDHAFTRRNLNRLQAGMVTKNGGSQGAFMNAGFQQEGILRQVYYCDGEYQDVQIMSILKSDWRKINVKDCK
jgi:RimJ/RimL family protein N-acetyltransferase